MFQKEGGPPRRRLRRTERQSGQMLVALGLILFFSQPLYPRLAAVGSLPERFAAAGKDLAACPTDWVEKRSREIGEGGRGGMPRRRKSEKCLEKPLVSCSLLATFFPLGFSPDDLLSVFRWWDENRVTCTDERPKKGIFVT